MINDYLRNFKSINPNKSPCWRNGIMTYIKKNVNTCDRVDFTNYCFNFHLNFFFWSTFLKYSLRNYNPHPLVILFWDFGLTLPGNECHVVLSLYIFFTNYNVIFHLTSMYHMFLIQSDPPYSRTSLIPIAYGMT